MTSKQLIASIATAGTLLTGGVVNNIQLQAQDEAINPYVETVDTLETHVKGNKVSVHKNEPKIIMEKWNGKDSLGVSYSKTKNKGKTNRKQLTKIAEYEVDNKESVVMESTEDGEGFNIDINLSSKPASNVFTYTFENWQDKDFFYQPALNVEMASSTCTETDCGNVHRPENVVGSYAVYSKVHKDHISGQTNYQTGKLFHIYRPLVSDANGSTTWATLNIVDGVMTVTVPWEFLDNGVYPVLVDPTFGYTTAGASSFQLYASCCGNEYQGSSYNLSGSGTVTAINTWLCGTAGTDFKPLIYLNGGSNVPTTRKVIGAATAVTTTCPTYTNQSVSVSVTLSAGDYFLGATADGGLAGVSLALDTTGANGYHSNGNGGFSYISPPDPWSGLAPTGTDTRKVSIYATYTASAPDSTPTIHKINSGSVKVLGGKVILN